MEDEEMIDEENIPEEEGDAAERDFIDEMLAEEDNNGRDNAEGVGVAGDGMWQALDAPIAWNPGRYAIYDDGTMRRAANAAVIDHDEVLRPNEETVRGMRDELDRLTAELANTITVDNTDNMIYYDPTALRGAMADAAAIGNAIATDDGEGHG
jgi:hypothetical protein